MKRPIDFALPWQRMHQLMKMHGHLRLAQRFAMFVQQAKVGHHAQRVRHRDHSLAQLDPIPGYARRLRFGVVTPQRLPAARGLVVAESQYSRAEVHEMQSGGRTRLPQYGRPGVHNPSGRRGARGSRCVDGRTSCGSFTIFEVWR